VFASGAEHGLVHHFQFAKGYLTEHQEIKVGFAADKFVPAGLTTTHDGKILIVCVAWGDVVKLIPLDDPTKQTALKLNKEDYPYMPLASKDGKRLYVSLWGRSGIAVYDLENQRIDSLWATSSHPTEMVLSPNEDILYVACANSNNVDVIETKSGKPMETISTALFPKAPSGSTPNSLSLTPDGNMLFIANADNQQHRGL
jgi:DNA-binding beta-propeller fold protein YncE